MSCLPRRRPVPTALVLGCLALGLAAPAAQAREMPPAGWLDALAHQAAQWVAGWWPAPAQAAPAPGKNQPAQGPRRPIRVECGVQVDPNGYCK